MARRHGRLGDHLATDDLTGFTVYASQLRRGYYGELAVRPLKRNLQEIASPYSDPQPVDVFRGPNYEDSSGCVAETAPLYVGVTGVPTSQRSLAFQTLNLSPAIGEMAVGCTFVVR
jgi:hypothetical protein